MNFDDVICCTAYEHIEFLIQLTEKFNDNSKLIDFYNSSIIPRGL